MPYKRSICDVFCFQLMIFKGKQEIPRKERIRKKEKIREKRKRKKE